MNSQLFSSSLSLSLVCFLLVILLKIQSSSTNPDLCGSPFRCGNVTAGYPFWGGRDRPDPSCGHPKLKLDCHDNLTTTITINEVNYNVLDFNESTNTLKIAREEYYEDGICPPLLQSSRFRIRNTTIDSQLFDFSRPDEYENVTLLYGCPPSSTNILEHFTCQINDDPHNDHGFIEPGAKGPGACNASVFVPVPKKLYEPTTGNSSALVQALQEGFELKWKVIGGLPCEDCTNSKGSCGYSIATNETICYCPDRIPPFSDRPCFTYPDPASLPSEPASTYPTLKASPASSPDNAAYAGIAAGVVGTIIILSIFLIIGLIYRTKNCRNMEAFMRNFGSLAPTRYNYSDVKKMTNSFSNKLGKGGYGDVYKGKLPDGRLVAVKLLKESKGDGEEFTNEVASISRTSHVNIVGLLGFCYTMNKRALIYEFMSNGSLDKFINDEESSSTDQILEWKTRYQIAIGIARGLEYLHRGCNTRIVHFDIKPHNILLDEDFCPKISDFGLAKLCKRKESIISMLGARGTAGYIAPEVFCRTFGEVSYKSDVYSYGMMILEMVGGRKNIAGIVSHTSEIYFPNWIYKQIEPGNDIEFHGVVTEEEKEIAKKMIIVSMWCIQTIPSDRPSMSKALEMLEGSLESMQIPPKPSLSLPARSPIPLSSFSTSTSSLIPISQGEICTDLSNE
ncbi:hypothetical protein ACOSQ4_026480 [Xanthoceras sorbifolium]